MGKITSKAWDDDPDVTSDLMKGGYIRVCKTGKEAPLPQSGEELRSLRGQQAFHESCFVGSRTAVVLRLCGLRVGTSSS